MATSDQFLPPEDQGFPLLPPPVKPPDDDDGGGGNQNSPGGVEESGIGDTTNLVPTLEEGDVPGIPPGAEFWKVGGRHYAVFFIPGSEPPIPLVYLIPEEELPAMEISHPIDFKSVTEAEFRQVGALDMGLSTLLIDTPDNPWDAFFDQYEDNLAIMPWLAEPDILALYASEWLKGGSPSSAQLSQTEWWQTHTQEERDWLLFTNSDPASAQRLIEDNRRSMRDLLQQAGIDNPDESLITFMSDQVTMGLWSQGLVDDQILALADPFSGIPIDPTLSSFLSENEINPEFIDTTRQGEDVVRQLVSRWLGPYYSDFWNDDNLAEWAGEIRNNPDAQLELTDILRSQRMTLFPNHTNENLTYEDIAAPMRGVFASVWGQAADETTPFFQRLLASNDFEGAERQLRIEGMKQGVRKVQNDALSGIVSSFGGSIVRADPAIL